MSREDYEIFDVLEKEAQQQRAECRSQAEKDFRSCRELATKHGITLVRHSETHYSISCEGWRVNVYPGNRRIYRERTAKIQAPHLRLPEEWGLLDVVKAAVETLS